MIKKLFENSPSLLLILCTVATASAGIPVEPTLKSTPDKAAASVQDSAAGKLLADFETAWKESNWEKNFRGIMYMLKTGVGEWKSRMTTLRSLVVLGEEAVPALTKALDSEHSPTRVLAAQALSYLSPLADLDRLKMAAENDKTPAARLYAVDALGTSGKGSTIEWKGFGGLERNRDVRKHMSYAMWRADNAISSDVITTLKDWDPATIDSAKVGSPAPDFTLNTIDGKPVKLSDFRGKQPVVLVFIYGDT